MSLTSLLTQSGPDLRLGAPGQDIFRDDMSCQTHFFQGAGWGSKAPFGGGPFGGGATSALPKSGPEPELA